MNLDEALDRVAQIHAHVLRAEVFRGYRSVPMALTGVVAVGAAGVQDLCIMPNGPGPFATYWLSMAVVCGIICLADIVWHARAQEAGALRRRTLPVLAQYLPTLAAGAVISAVLLDRPEAALLPGLWAILHGLGIFASRPFLPRAVGWVSLAFLAAGTLALFEARSGVAPSPWTMGLTFGFGQAAFALVLHLDIERPARAGEETLP